MPKKIIIVLMLLMFLPLGGCGDKTAANEGNFEEAIVAFLDAHPPTVQLMAELPYKAPVDRNYFGGAERGACERLVAAGLLEKQSSVMEQTILGQPREIQAIEYDLSDTGRAAFIPPDEDAMVEVTRFRYGDYEVVEVTNFTAPTEMNGRTISRMDYTYRVVNLADWAHHEDLVHSHLELQEVLAADGEPREATAVAVLTDNGWEVELVQAD